MSDDPQARLIELSQRSWSTPAEFEALNAEYNEALADLAHAINVGDPLRHATVAGTNASDRQSIKRKAERWRNNFVSLHPAEKVAVLSALIHSIKGD